MSRWISAFALIAALLTPRSTLFAQASLDTEELGRLRSALLFTDSTQAALAQFAASSRPSDLVSAIRFASIAGAIYPRAIDGEDANVRGARDFVGQVAGSLGARLIGLLVRDGGRLDPRTVGNPLTVAAEMTATQVRLALESLNR